MKGALLTKYKYKVKTWKIYLLLHKFFTSFQDKGLPTSCSRPSPEIMMMPSHSGSDMSLISSRAWFWRSEEYLWSQQMLSINTLYPCFICLTRVSVHMLSYLSVWGCSWCWPLWSLAECGSDTTALPGPSHWRDWPITVVAWDEVADFLKILWGKRRTNK